LFSINPNALGAGVPSFVIGSSTATNLIVTQNGNVGIGSTSPNAVLSVDTGSVLVKQYDWGTATSTTPTLNLISRNSQHYGHGTAATTFSFGALYPGAQVVLTIENPGGTAGAITWPSACHWSGGVVPGQTTTAYWQDDYYFYVTNSSTTPIVHCSQSPGYN
jgi:hypothetical protein